MVWHQPQGIHSRFQWIPEDWKGTHPNGTVTDPVGPSSGSRRVYRGGGWGSGSRHCWSVYRGYVEPDGRGNDLGFRLLRVVQ